MLEQRVKATLHLPVFLIGLCLLVCSLEIHAKNYLVGSQNKYQAIEKKVKPGDTIILKNGVWNNFEILFRGKGTADKPITLRAQKAGKVIISGQSNLRMAGEHLIVSGLVFRDGHTPTEAVISYRKSASELANHSRVTQVVIDNFNNPERTETDYWVAMYGKHNRFDHNHLEGKRNKGVTMAVRLNSEASQQNHHRIDHNYFGPRQILGSNGGETLRVGTSHFSQSESFTVVENNYFDRCDGELEIISNKSGGNVYRGNVFFESRGTLTMRHGSDTLVEDNVFFGNGVDHTGGIRVINGEQTIRNNYMEGLAGYRFGGALVVMNGVPNSPINRYHQVKNALIENNSLIDSDHIQLAAGSDVERSAIPIDSQFRNNLIYHAKSASGAQDGHKVFTVYDDISGIAFENNVQHNRGDFGRSHGFTNAAIELQRASNGLMYPVGNEFGQFGVAKGLSPIQKSQTGTEWYPKPNAASKFAGGASVNVPAESGALANAIKQAKAGDVLVLAAGEHVVSRILAVDQPVTLRAAGSPHSAKIVYERTALFEIQDGGSLSLIGLAIDGGSAPDSSGNSVVRTQRSSMLVNYELLVSDTRVANLDINHSFNFLNAAKSTFADRIEIKNSHFSNITGAILKLDPETDDYGIYNSEYVTITDSVFEKVAGALVTYYRGGTDESTFGPHFVMVNTQLDKVGDGRRNKSAASIHLHGVQVTRIQQSEIANSPAISVLHTVGEPVTRISDNTFLSTTAPKVVELNSKEKDTASITNNRYK